MNRLTYKEAIIYDNRTYFQYYWSILKQGHIVIFSFIRRNDYNSQSIKIFLFFFSFGCYYTVNALFFTDDSIHHIYIKEGEYDFIYQIPYIIYSTLICSVINTIVKMLSLTQKDILSLKLKNIGENLEQKKLKIKKGLLIKFILFFIISLIFLIFFWFYIASFCAVYRNTQIFLIYDTIISFGLSLIYPFGYYLMPGMFRIPALRNKNKNSDCIYKISLFFQSI